MTRFAAWPRPSRDGADVPGTEQVPADLTAIVADILVARSLLQRDEIVRGFDKLVRGHGMKGIAVACYAWAQVVNLLGLGERTPGSMLAFGIADALTGERIDPDSMTDKGEPAKVWALRFLVATANDDADQAAALLGTLNTDAEQAMATGDPCEAATICYGPFVLLDMAAGALAQGVDQGLAAPYVGGLN